MTNGKTIVELYMSCGAIGLDELYYPETETLSLSSWGKMIAEEKPEVVAIRMRPPGTYPFFSRRKGDRLLIFTLFGTANVDISGHDGTSKTVFFCPNGTFGLEMEMPSLSCWMGEDSVFRPSIYASRAADGFFIPLSDEVLKIPEGGDWSTWVDVVVPGVPSDIRKTREGGCTFISAGQPFLIDEPKKAKLVLSGNVRWIAPGPDGSFVEPPAPTSPSERSWVESMRKAIELLKAREN